MSPWWLLIIVPSMFSFGFVAGAAWNWLHSAGASRRMQWLDLVSRRDSSRPAAHAPELSGHQSCVAIGRQGVRASFRS